MANFRLDEKVIVNKIDQGFFYYFCPAVDMKEPEFNFTWRIYTWRNYTDRLWKISKEWKEKKFWFYLVRLIPVILFIKWKRKIWRCHAMRRKFPTNSNSQSVGWFYSLVYNISNAGCALTTSWERLECWTKLRSSCSFKE